MRRISGDQPGERRTDPDYVATVEVFDNLGYDEIQRGVASLRPEILSAGRQSWHNSGVGLADAVQQANAEIRAAIAEGWRGSAAEMAAGAVTAFEQLGLRLSDVMTEVERRLGQATDAAETVRASVTQPIAGRPDLEAALLDPKRAAANVTVQKESEGLRQDAVRVMNSVYAGVFVPTGDGIPSFPEEGMYPAAAAPTAPPTLAPARAPAPPDAPAATPGPVNLKAPGAIAGTGKAPVVVDGSVPAAAPASAPADNDQATVTASVAAVEIPVGGPVSAGVPPVAAPIAPAITPGAPTTVAATAVPGIVATNPIAGQRYSSIIPAGQVTVSAAVGSATQPSDTQRKRDDHDRQDSGVPASDSSAGMGAGIVGGLAGGAVAAGDVARSGPPAPTHPRRAENDEDDEYYLEFDEPTYLEPGVGNLDPTTPPVLGEWDEDA